MSNISSRNAFDVLRRIGQADGPKTAAELGRGLDIPTTTLHRTLATLEQAGMIARYRSSQHYVLGEGSSRLAHAFFGRFALRDAAIPYLRRLCAASGETASLMMPVGWHSVRIASIKGMRDIVHTAPLGEVKAFDDGVASQVLLALAGEPARARYLERHRGRGDMVAHDALLEALALAERQRFLSRTSGNGVVSIAMPLFVDRLAIACITIEGVSLKEDVVPPACREIVQDLEALVRGRPDDYRSHYSHIDPDQIVLK